MINAHNPFRILVEYVHAVARSTQDKYTENNLTLLFSSNPLTYPGGSFNFKDTFGQTHLSHLTLHF